MKLHGTLFSPLKGKESDHTINTIPHVDNLFWYFQKTLSNLKDSLSNRVEFRYKLATCLSVVNDYTIRGYFLYHTQQWLYDIFQDLSVISSHLCVSSIAIMVYQLT